MSEKIQASSPIFNVATIKTVKANLVKGATAPSANTVLPVGYPLVAKTDGTWEVFTKAALAAQIQGTAGSALPKQIGVLAEECTVATTMPTNVKVVYAGEVYLDSCRDVTDITKTDIGDHVFMNACGHIIFTNLNDKQIHDLV